MLACGRGLVSPADRARLEAAPAVDLHLAQRLVQQGLVSPAALSALLQELTVGGWGCPACQVRCGWLDLARLPRLICPRCQGPLVARGAAGSASALAGATRGGPGSRVAPVDAQAETRGGPASAVGGGPTSSARIHTLPRRLGPYTLHALLGKGSCAKVYLARRDDVSRDFALKVVEDPDPEDRELLLRFRREVDVASRIRHPGVVPVVHAGEEGGIHYYAMEYCPGVTLKERLKAEGPLPPREAARLVARIARAAQAAHAEGVIHRDLKPANIIVEEASGEPRITDFGMARDERARRSMTETGDVLGTPFYMAPEQFRGERDLDHRIDVYALGVILYELLCGQRPYDAATALALKKKIERGDPPSLRAVCEGLPARLERACLRAMAVEKEDRHPSAQALAEELEAVAESLAPAPSGSRRLLLVGLGLGGLGGALAAGGVALFLLGRQPAPAAPAPPPTAPAPSTGDVERLLQQAAALQSRQAGLLAPQPWEEVERTLAAAEAAAAADPDARTRVALARAGYELRRGRWGEALRLAQGRGPEGQLLCARALEKLGRREEARQGWRALEAQAEGPLVLVARAALARLDGAPGRAEALAREAGAAAAGASGEAAAWLELARALVARGQLDQVAPALDALTRLHPDDPEEALLRARVSLARNDRPGALGHLQRAELLGAGDDPDRLSLEARLALSRQDLEGARRAVERALQLDPRHLESLIHRVVLTARSAPNDQTSLLGAWNAACEVDEVAASAVMSEAWPEMLARLEALQGGRWKRGAARARRWVERVVEEVPPAARTSLHEALSAAVQGANWDAIAVPASAACAAGIEPVVARQVARLLVGRARGGEAIQHLERLPESAERERLRGEALWSAGRPGAAAEALGRAAGLDPRGAEGLTAEAERMWIGREDARALTAVEEALAAAPEHYPARVVRALVLAGLSRDKEALEAVKEAHAWCGFLDARLLVVLQLIRAQEADLADMQTAFVEAFQQLFGGQRPAPARKGASEQEELGRIWGRNANHHLWVLARDLAWRRKDWAFQAGGGRRSDDAYGQLVTGRELLGQRTATREHVRTAWRRARALDPQLRFSAADARDLRGRWPQTGDVEAFLGE